MCNVSFFVCVEHMCGAWDGNEVFPTLCFLCRGFVSRTSRDGENSAGTRSGGGS